MALFDLLNQAMGRTNPDVQIAQALNPTAMQGGSAQPNLPGGVPAPGAAPQQGGAGGAPAGAPQPGAPAQAPEAQLLQSPSDLNQMYQQAVITPQQYLQMVQYHQREEGFNRGLALMASSFGPLQTRPAIMQSMDNMSGNPDAMVNTMMNLNQTQYQHQALMAAAQQLGLSPALVLADPSIIGKVTEQRMGLGGPPEQQMMIRAQQAWDQDPETAGKPYPWKRNDFGSYQIYQQGQQEKQKDLVADQHNFAPALGNYDKALGLIDRFNQPDMQEGAKEFLGTLGSVTPVAAMSAKGKAAYALYKQIMATQFAAGTLDFKGAGRITQSELAQDAPSQSTMGQLNQTPEDFFSGVGRYRDQLAQHRANLFGTAQKATDPRLSDADYTKYVAPNMDVFGGPERKLSTGAPASSSGQGPMLTYNPKTGRLE